MKKMKLLIASTLCAGMMAAGCGASAEEVKTFTIDDTIVENKTELEVTEGTIETKKEDDKEIFNVILKDQEGKEHLFEKVDVEEWKNLTFVEDYEMLYIRYTDKDGKNREAEEKCDEILWDEPVTMFALGSVNIRTAPGNDAEAIYYASLGEEFKTLGIAPGWFKIELADEKEGYIYHKYLSEDKEAVDQLIEEARLAAEAAAAMDEYVEDYNYAAPAPSGGSGGGSNKAPKKNCITDGILN